MTDNLAIRAEDDGPHHACVKCDVDLGPTRDNYKDRCIVESHNVTDAVPLAGDPARYIDATPEFRQFFCPGCGALIENEIALSGDPVLRDIELDENEAWVRRPRAAAE